MKITVKIENRQISVVLAEKGKKLDEISFPEDHDLSQKLLPAIDKILLRNKRTMKDTKKARLISDIKEPYTSYRIAKATVNGLNWG